MNVVKYNITNHPMPLIPGTKRRDWMDKTPNQYAYRCLPLSIANSTGWDLYMPCDLMVSWNGKNGQNDIQLNQETDDFGIFADSGFGCGIVTFHPGFILRTPPEWDLLVTGPVNETQEGGMPLTGLVETFWLKFTFTMNWKITKPGTFVWKKDIPIARLMPYPHFMDVTTDEKHIHENKAMSNAYHHKAMKRSAAIDDLFEAYKTESDVGSVEYGKPSTEWDKEYYRGVDSDGEIVYDHITKRNFPKFGE